MNFTEEQLKKAKQAKSIDELIALAKENGMEQPLESDFCPAKVIS